MLAGPDGLGRPDKPSMSGRHETHAKRDVDAEMAINTPTCIELGKALTSTRHPDGEIRGMA